MNKPNEEHLETVYRLLWYLKMTPRKDIYFNKGTDRKVDIFTEADWVCSISEIRPTTGYCTCMGEHCYLVQ